MNELIDLFPELAISQPPRLTAARLKLEHLQADLDKASEWEDETGEPVPGELIREYRRAVRLVANLEREEVGR